MHCKLMSTVSPDIMKTIYLMLHLNDRINYLLVVLVSMLTKKCYVFLSSSWAKCIFKLLFFSIVGNYTLLHNIAKIMI